MKQSHFLPLMLLALFMSSCTTYQYTARQTEINRRPMDTKEQRAGIRVDYTKRVTATSSYQLTRKDAIAEAEFICIEEAKIDVVVDPIYKIEFNPFKWKKNFRATIIGYAGMYEEKQTLLDESKQYTIDDIEKYKLLYDPDFLQYYYQKDPIQGGDVYNYYIKSNGAAAAPAGAYKLAPQPQQKKATSVMLQNNQPKRPLKLMSADEMFQAKKLRDGGLITMGVGVVTCLVVGMPVFFTGFDKIYVPYSNGYGGYHKDDEGQIISGAVLMGLGAATGVSGIIMASVGGARYDKGKKAQRQMDLTFNAGANGIGIGLTF